MRIFLIYLIIYSIAGYNLYLAKQIRKLAKGETEVFRDTYKIVIFNYVWVFWGKPQAFQYLKHIIISFLFCILGMVFALMNLLNTTGVI